MIFNVNVGAPARPVGYFSYGGNTYRFDGTSEVSVTNVFKYSPYGTSGWKMWILANGVSVHFDYINPQHSVGISAVGAGGDGGHYHEEDGAYGGAGGGAGGGLSALWGSMSPNSNISFTLNSTDTSASGALNISAAKGGNGQNSCVEAGRYNGNKAQPGSGNTTGYGGTGAYAGINGANPHPATAGGKGVYLFDNIGFDGVRYGAGAGGNGTIMFDMPSAGNGDGWGNRGSGARENGTPKLGIIALWHQG